MFALWASIALAALLVLDIGNLFWQKRELQKMADLAALSGAIEPVETRCQPVALDVAKANGLQIAGGDTLRAQAGHWGSGPQGVGVQFLPAPVAGGVNAPRTNACHVELSRSVDYFFVWPASGAASRQLTAQATAVASLQRMARISVRTKLANLNTRDSLVLNALVGGLLGGELNLDVMGWQGLANLDVDLLTYLDALALRLNLQAGGYDQLLRTQVGVGDLLSALITAVEQGGNTTNVSLQALRAIEAQARLSSLRLQLIDLLKVQTGLPSEALRTDLNVLQLVQGVVQVGNSNSAVAGSVALPLGLVGVNAYVQVIEPPQLSAIGDPELAKQQPRGAHEIFVRSAQTRVLLSTELPVVGGVTTLLNGLLTVLSPVLSLVNLLLGGGTGLLDINVLPSPMRIDIGLDLGSGYGYLTDYSCTPGDKHVRIQSRTAVADLRLGKWGETAEQARQNAFASQSLAPIGSIPVVRLDCLNCHGQSRIRQYFGGLGLKLDVPVVASTPKSLKLQPVDALDKPIQWSAATSVNGVIASLGPTIMGLDALTPLPADSRASAAGVRGLLNALDGVLGQVLSTVSSLIVTILAPLLDPIVDSLLKLLGVTLAGAQYGAQLNCGSGVPELVY